MEEHTCLHSKPAEKGRKKKQKNPGINLGIWVWKNIPAYTTNLPEKGEKKNKKTLVLTLEYGYGRTYLPT